MVSLDEGVRLTALDQGADFGRTATFSQRAPVARRIANVRSNGDDRSVDERAAVAS